MSKLEDLIQELCPDGVEYKKITEIATTFIGLVTTMTKHYVSEGVPLIHNSSIKAGRFEFKEKIYLDINFAKQNQNRRHKIGDIITVHTGDVGTSAIIDDSLDGSLGFATIVSRINDPSKISREYVCHFFNSHTCKNQIYSMIKGDRNNLNLKDFNKIVVPLPPMPVQEEIVHILDSFTELTAELTAELTTELTARKKQYEYYLNSFFGADIDKMISKCKQNNIPIDTLENIGSLQRGKRFVKADAVEIGAPCIHYGELYTHYGVWAKSAKSFLRKEQVEKLRVAQKGDVIIVGAGENDIDIGIGVAWFGDDDIAVHDACYAFKHKQNPKYISYYLRSNVYHTQIKKYVSSGKICAISASGIGKSLIPLPSLEEQKRIVDILDRFDKLCNDISEGLLAEIEARQKQYEYYRDKLLTFKEAV